MARPVRAAAARERGRVAVGADWSLRPLRAGARAGAPVSVMDLRAPGDRHRRGHGLLSLGVVEHDPGQGPDASCGGRARGARGAGGCCSPCPHWNGAPPRHAYLRAGPG